MARIEVRGVAKQIEGAAVLEDVDLDIAPGEVLGLIGPSGSGKTTILRLIAGLDAPTSGSVTIGGDAVDLVHPWKNGVGMVFQDDALYEHLDVGGNVGFSIRLTGAGRAEADVTARRRVKGTGLRPIWRRRTRSLSGGERGMVAVGRAIAREGVRVILFDEPLAQADLGLRARFREQLRRLHAETGMTMVIATNDQDEAMALSQRVAVLHEGRVLQVAPPRELYLDPRSAAVASFVGSPPMNLIPGLVEQDDSGWWIVVGTDRLRPDIGLPPDIDGERVLVGLHAGEIAEATPGTPFERVIHATCGLFEDPGARPIVRFGLGTVPAAGFAMYPNRPVQRGTALELTWEPGRLRLFDSETGTRLL